MGAIDKFDKDPQMKKINVNTRPTLASFVLNSIAVSSSVTAQEWQFEATPYVWAAANEGSAGTYGLVVK